jgi:transcriptional regulator with XRE-family HTH domain
MRSKIAQRIIDQTPAEVKIFVKKYGDFVVRVHQVLKEKGITQKELAKRMEKTPSEISKWLSGDHNLTLRSIAKLEAELEMDLIYISKKDSFHVQRTGSISATVPPQKPVGKEVKFIPASEKTNQEVVASQAS